MRILKLSIPLVAFAAATCGAHATNDQLRARAAFDLDCDGGKLHMIKIDERTVGVRGCGAKAIYIESCEVGANQFGSYRHNCTWVLNADTRHDRPAHLTGGLGNGIGKQSD